MNLRAHAADPGRESFHRYPRSLARLAALLPSLVLVGWALNLEIVTQLVPGRMSAPPSAALCGLLIAIAASLRATPGSRWQRRLGQFLAAAVVVLAGLFLLARLLDLAPSLPQRHDEWRLHALGLPSAAAACALMVLAMAALTLDVRPRWRVRPSELLAMLGGSIAYVGVAAHAYGAVGIYQARPASLTGFSLPVAITLVIVASSVALARPDRGAAAAFFAPSAGGYFARRLALVAVTLPLVFGVLVELLGGFLDARSSLALISMTTSVLGLSLILLIARSANAAERARELGEEHARRLASIVETTEDAIATLDLEGHVLSWNAAAERLYGIPAGEAVGKLIEDLGVAPPERLPAPADLVGRVARGENISGFETVGRRRGGELLHISLTLSALRDNDGVAYGISAIMRDVSARTRVERQLLESEARYRALVEFAPDGVLVTGENRRFCDTNLAMCRLLGLERHEILGKTALDLVVPEERGRLSTTRSRTAHVETWHLTRKDGRVVEVEIAGNPLPDGRTLAFVRDLSERRRAEALLRESEARYRIVVEGATDGIFMADRRGRLTDVNPRGAAMLGCTRDEIVGRDFLDFVPEDEGQRLSAELSAALRGETVTSDWRMRRKDGSWIEVEVRARMLPDGRWLGLARDVTQRRELVRALKSAHDAEHQLRRHLEDWSSVIAHDLRQPLSVIDLSTAALGRGLAEPQAGRAITRLRRASHRLSRMIEDLLDVSRLDTSQMKLLRERVELPSLVEEVVDETVGLPADRKVRVERRAELPPVLADASRVEQILGNLLSNAVKYGTSDGEIIVALDRRDNEALVSVTNHGPGIPEAEQSELFERFHRTQGAERGHAEGLGLGLYIARGLVQAHGGDIWVESHPGRTTTFSFTMPFAEAVDDNRSQVHA